MAAADDEVPDWTNFKIGQSISLSFLDHAQPTDLYNNAKEKYDASLTMAFTDPMDLFTKSRSVASAILSNMPEGTTDLAEAYDKSFRSIFASALDDNDNETNTEAVIHALRLAGTSPDIFGFCCELNPDENEATFTFSSFLSATVDATTGQERHDMVQWIACYHVLGKAFSMEGWVSAFATSLVPLSDPTEAAIKVHYGSETFIVTRSAKDAMSEAVDALKNKPTLFFRMAYVMCAVSKILGLETLEYTMPQSQEELNAFNWNEVIPGRAETYPKSLTPTNEDYQKVKTVHELVKKEKDEAARKLQYGKSGVQSYITMRQRWREWQEIHAIYRYMNKSDTLQMVADRVKFRLKLCTSWDAMQTEIATDVEKHIAKLKKDRKKQEQAEEVKEQIKVVKAAEEAEKQQQPN
jgi:hypothetical protein